VRIQILAFICGVLCVSNLVSAAPQEVTFVTKDSVTIYGTFYPCGTNEKAPGLVLLHMLKHKRQDWDAFAQDAVKAGFAVLTIDLRGHGQSVHQGERILDVNEFSNAEFALSVEDVSAAVEFLRKEPGVDGGRISLVGASIGANLALKCAATDTTIRSVVLLSPGLEYRGLTTEDAMVRYGNRPILLIASRDDDYASDSVVKLASVAKGSVRQQLFENAGHGTFMFQVEPDLGKMMLDWLKSAAQ
jgi:alpha-beta hydrolase superfamily lysophospholipase